MKKYAISSKKWLAVIFVIVASNIMITSTCQAQTSQRVLIVTGGHEFEREAFFHMFEDLPGIDYQEIIHPQANYIYASPLIDSFDVLLFYDMVQEIDETQKTAFLNLVKQGKGLVFLHHSLASYQEWQEFGEIIGGRYLLSGKDQDLSTYRHDVEVPVTIVSDMHPITRGISDFVIHDEVYGNYTVLSSVQPLLRTTHPESSEIIGWTNTYEKSRIVYIQLGHDHFAYENPNYRLLLKQSIDWVQNK